MEFYFFPTPRDHPRGPLHHGLDALLNLFFPQDCLVCERETSRHRDRAVCRRCWDRVAGLRLRRPMCPVCGLPFHQSPEAEDHLCGRCLLELPPFSGARAFGYYSAELRRIVHALKFDGRRNLADACAPLMASTFVEHWERSDADLVVPVPLHARRRRERGFNQADLLGRGVARLTGLPFEARALLRERHGPSQAGLSDARRWRNVRGAFRCDARRVIGGARVLLVDDVVTTGATAAAASEALLEASARKVWVLSLARAVPGVE